MSEILYRALAALAEPALSGWLRLRARRGKEEASRLAERRGRAPIPRPAGSLLWVHAASLGETRSALPLLDRLQDERPALHVLMTTMTVTAARLIEERKRPRVLHQFVPLDVPRWIGRFLDHWRPDAALWVEGELWPNLVAAARARGVPMALVNARMSARSFARWRAARHVLPPPLSAFAPCLAQSEADAERLRLLGVAARFVGNLKFDGAPLPADARALDRLLAEVGGRPLWLAASTHRGEEEIVASAHVQMARKLPGLLTVLAPRHAQRGDEIAAMLRGRDLAVAQRGRGEPIGPTTAVYLADTMGELGLFYRLARVTFIGGSLVPHGGQNALEAARLDCALMFGPHMWNFRDVARTLIEAGGAIEVADAGALAAAALRLIGQTEERMRRAAAAASVADAGRGALNRVLAELAPLIAALDAGQAHARA
jgi:3-deoxy-D-manno-octulosonic-acid transferase